MGFRRGPLSCDWAGPSFVQRGASAFHVIVTMSASWRATAPKAYPVHCSGGDVSLGGRVMASQVIDRGRRAVPFFAP